MWNYYELMQTDQSLPGLRKGLKKLGRRLNVAPGDRECFFFFFFGI